MSQTILLVDDEVFRELMSINLSSYLGTDIVGMKSFAEAKGLIEHHPGIDLICCNLKNQDEETASELLSFLAENSKEIPVIVFGSDGNLTDKYNHAKFIESRPDAKLLVAHAAKTLGITANDIKKQILPDYYPVSSKACLGLTKTPCEIFIKIQKSGEDQYVKRFDPDQDITEQDIQKYIDKGVKHFYVFPKYRLTFAMAVTSGLTSKLDAPETTVDEKVEIVEESVGMLQKHVTENDDHPVKEEIQKLMASTIKAAVEIAKDFPKVTNLLKKLLENKSSFMYKHTTLITYVAKHIIMRSDWGSLEQVEKFSFISLFHDIVLKEDEYAKVHCVADLEILGLEVDTKTKEVVKKHALLAANVVKRFPNAPMGADTIILQHHGSLSGVGFPQEYPVKLAPLAKVFIVAEKFVLLILENEDVEDMNELKEKFVKTIKSDLNSSKLKDLVELLVDIPL